MYLNFRSIFKNPFAGNFYRNKHTDSFLVLIACIYFGIIKGDELLKVSRRTGKADDDIKLNFGT